MLERHRDPVGLGAVLGVREYRRRRAQEAQALRPFGELGTDPQRTAECGRCPPARGERELGLGEVAGGADLAQPGGQQGGPPTPREHRRIAPAQVVQVTTGVEQALQRQWEVPGGRRRTAAAQPVHRALGQSRTCEIGVGVGAPDPDLLHHGGGRQGHRERGDRRVRIAGGETDLASTRECEQGVQIRGTAGARRRALLHGEPVRQRPCPVRRHQCESQELGQRAGRIQLAGRDDPQQPRPEPRHGGGRHPTGERGAVQQDGD
ncbi:hypothetical protein, partial [Pseudonocardia sp. Ae406_Ps2]|uniref:hypothetical protein n=1 Tax=Pseudonocardia sp. Ae406_Ps2 TaxID=1885033 RepID=UPI001BB05017